MVGYIISSEDIQDLILDICECYLIWQKQLVDVIKIRMLRWGNDSALSRWVLAIITGVLIR